MDKARIIAETRKLIADAEVEKALRQLLPFLEETSGYRHLHNDALQALSRFRKISKEETQGIISYDEAKLGYNQVVNQVLQILEDLQQGTPPPLRRSRAPWLIGTTVLLLGLLAVWFFILRDTGAVPCPDFKPDSRFNILIWPYQPLSKNTGSLPQLAIQQNLENLASKYNIDLCPRIIPREETFPKGRTEAESQGQKCNVQLVIWGTVEDRNGNIFLTTNYKFLNLGDHFSFQKLNMKGVTEMDTVSAVSTITTDGIVKGKIEDAIKYLFGIVAGETGNPKALIQELSAATVDQKADSAAALTRQMFLADAFIRLDDTTAAESAYDTILTSIHPNYAFALNNRASIYLSRGKYEAAIIDLTTHLEGLPVSATSQRDTLLSLRAEAYLQAQQLEKARIDLQELRESQPENPQIKKRLDKVQQNIEAEKRRKTEAESRLQRNPGNTAALTEKATASRRIGDYADAIQAATPLFRRNPSDLIVIRTLIESYLALDQTAKAKEVIESARQAGVPVDTLHRLAPSLVKKGS